MSYYDSKVSRFYEFDDLFDTAKKELQNGKKRTHWMWYFFPQLRGMEDTEKGYYYGLDGYEEARDYYKDRKLRKRLVTLTKLLLKEYVVFSYMDFRRLKASMTLFYIVSGKYLFKKVIDTYFDGEFDRRTEKWNSEQNKY